MENIATVSAHTSHTNNANKEIRNVTVILTVLTLIELALGYSMISISSDMLKLFIKGTIVILMLAKAFYIVAYFMHLRHEIKSMIWTIILPLTFFIWFIIAFLADGHSFNNLKNKYDRHYKENTQKASPKTE